MHARGLFLAETGVSGVKRYVDYRALNPKLQGKALLSGGVGRLGETG